MFHLLILKKDGRQKKLMVQYFCLLPAEGKGQVLSLWEENYIIGRQAALVEIQGLPIVSLILMITYPIDTVDSLCVLFKMPINHF